MEDYPYSATGNDLLDPADQARMLFGEALQRVWADLELNVEALGPAGEPVHGTVLITSLWVATCDSGDFPMCDPLAGRAVSPTANEVHRRGTAIVTDEPSLTSMWLTLAHETGHTIGLVHDDFPGGFMNEDSGTENGLGISVDPEFPNADNNSRWEAALLGSKGQAPRSSGFYMTGCAGPAECAPLGKPGWSCSGLFCIEDSP